MNPVDESAVPRKGKAREAFVAAMESWDEEAADPAAAGLARSCGPDEVFELLWQYGARDYRYIGHKSIFLANGWRTLQYAGWQHAEGVVRSLARAMTAYFHEQGHPNQTNQLADRSWRQNRKLATTIRAGWQSGKPDGGAGAAFSATLRRGSTAEASEAAVALLNREIGPQVIWDGVLNGVSELLMTWPGANMVHAVTTANAVHFAYQTSNSEETQKLLLLQAAAFVPLFRDDLGKGSRLQNVKQIEWLEPRPLDGGGKGAIEEIFAAVSEDPRAAAEKTLTYLRDQGDPQKIIDRARQLVFLKGDEYHDYKYSSAVLEDVGSISPEHRNRFLAASMFYLRGSGEPDTDLAKRIQAAV
jgi:hypothetical protein